MNKILSKSFKIISLVLILGCTAFFSFQHKALASEYRITRTPSENVSSSIKKVMPAVVSIVSSKNLPRMQVLLGNPFAGDPDFDDIDIRVPVGYREIVAPTTIGVGSGIIGTHNGYVITAKHVVDDPDAAYTVILSDGSKKPATVVYRDPHNDIAVVKIDGYYDEIATLGDSSEVEEGDEVSAIGNAFGKYKDAISNGTITDFNKSITAGEGKKVEKLSGLLETSAPLVPGYSGGPLIDQNGNVIGIDVALDGETGLGYTIPINTVKKSIAAPFIAESNSNIARQL